MNDCSILYQKALLPSVEDVVFPYRDAVVGESDSLETVPHQAGRNCPESSTQPGRVSQVLSHVNSEILDE